jgi:hypothetical protein
MSLTSRLRDVNSPVREYLDRISPRLQATGGYGPKARAAVRSIGFADLTTSAQIVAPFPGTDRALVGTAVDIRARIELGGFLPAGSTSAAGVALLAARASSVENGYHRSQVMSEVFVVAVGLLRSSIDTDRDTACILLAYCEQIYRAGAKALEGSLGLACDAAVDGAAFAEQVDPLLLADVRSVMSSNGPQLDRWRDQIASGQRFDPNPTFAGSHLVDGADADWLIGETLIDSKVYAAPSSSSLRDALRQLLGYVMLDTDDALRIRRVGVWLPRQGLMPTWGLDALLDGDPGELLPPLREEFVKATANNQVARVTPIPLATLHKRLADNRHTPFEMMAELGLSGDTEVRRRIARNAVAPEATVRRLSTDQRWEVREGVAMNEATPHDVLTTLSTDKSVAVRRAVAANPGGPRELRKQVSVIPRQGRRSIGRASSSDPGETAASTGADVAALETSQRSQTIRAGQPLDSRWLVDLLNFLESRPDRVYRMPIPPASLRWAYKSDRKLAIPEWMRTNLPDEVIADLIQPERAVWFRKWAARQLPVTDAAVRERLLDDADPEMRWSTLLRTGDLSDEALGDRLAELATSREARLHFRTAGMGARRDWARTAAWYDDETLRFVASHRSTPVSVLQTLASSSSPKLRANLIENRALPTKDRMKLTKLMAGSKSISSRVLLASLRNLPEEIALRIASDRDVGVRSTLSVNADAPHAALAYLALDSERSVRFSVLENRGTPVKTFLSVARSMLLDDAGHELHQILHLTADRAEMIVPANLVQAALDRLAKSRIRSPDMRVVAGRDLRAGVKTLTRLARTADDHVRGAVATNPNVPAAVIEQLAADPVADVRAAVALNSSCPPALLVTLAEDDYSAVRLNAAASPHLSRGSLDALLIDSDQGVRHEALRNPLTPPEVLEEAIRAARQPSSSRADLVMMIASPHADVRIRAAYDEAAAPDMLAMLAGERRGIRVHRVVAANPNTPPAVLRSLATLSDNEVLQALAFNGSSPPDLLRELAAQSVDLALLVIMNPDAGNVIDDLIEDSNPLVRYAAARARAALPIAGGEPDATSLAASADDDGHEPETQ